MDAPGRRADTLLRLAVAALAGGAAAAILSQRDHPLFAFLFLDLDWPESAALAAIDAGACLLLAAGAALFTPWRSAAAKAIGAWMLLSVALATAQATRHAALVPLAGALRCAAPFALRWTWQRPERAAAVLRWATAATVAGHGLQAWLLEPRFLDYLFRAGQLAGAELSQRAAELLLRGIAVVDVSVALLLAARRWPPVAAWMVLWGGLTAAVRVLHGGGGAWPETSIRLVHAAAPACLFLYWTDARGRPTHPRDAAARAAAGAAAR